MAKIKVSRNKIFILLLVVFVLIQFKKIDKTNPEVVPEKDFLIMTNVPDNLGQVFKSACYDCHSNTSKYPWYSNVAPFSWWMRGHIDNARGNINYSDWGDMSEGERTHAVKESIDMINKEWMPIGVYKLMHSEARITREQRDEVIQWLEQLQK